MLKSVILGASSEVRWETGSVRVSLLHNPSHLEAVNPVSMGKTRAKQMTVKNGGYSEGGRRTDKILNVQVSCPKRCHAKCLYQKRDSRLPFCLRH